ncbi:hypothetical protein ACFSSA_01590 [Luteolibacter algae]|uniref:Tetratricopeptide repeat protein n=1 Tax=Luteolibacter algae TaxID=454151 RepID=A0ABW5D3V1_9BACT
MKKLILALLVPAFSISAMAQKDFQAEAILSSDSGTINAWILAATKTSIRYKKTAVSTDHTDGKINDFSLIYLKEPSAFSEAMDLFESRKYKTAQAKFAEYKEFSKPVETLKGNYSTLSAFYEMECMRKLGDYEGLSRALQNFSKEPLVRDYHLRQLDLYVMWDAARTKAWDRLLSMAEERANENLPDYQRAQVAYCKGLALQNLKRPDEALLAYNTAMTADAGASEEIAQEAIFNALRIYYDNEEVQTALKAMGTEEQNKNSRGYTLLAQASSLAKLYDSLLKTGQPLPSDLRNFLKFES